MASLSSCPRCSREARDALSSNWFPVHTCRKCGEKYCDDCGSGTGTKCPECGSNEYSDHDKVYA